MVADTIYTIPLKETESFNYAEYLLAIFTVLIGYFIAKWSEYVKEKKRLKEIKGTFLITFDGLIKDLSRQSIELTNYTSAVDLKTIAYLKINMVDKSNLQLIQGITYNERYTIFRKAKVNEKDFLNFNSYLVFTEYIMSKIEDKSDYYRSIYRGYLESYVNNFDQLEHKILTKIQKLDEANENDKKEKYREIQKIFEEFTNNHEKSLEDSYNYLAKPILQHNDDTILDLIENARLMDVNYQKYEHIVKQYKEVMVEVNEELLDCKNKLSELFKKF